MTNYKNEVFDARLKKLETDYQNGIIGFGTFVACVFELGCEYERERVLSHTSDVEERVPSYNIFESFDKNLGNKKEEDITNVDIAVALTLVAEHLEYIKRKFNK